MEADERIVTTDELSAVRDSYDAQIGLGKAMSSMYSIVNNDPAFRPRDGDFKLVIDGANKQRNAIILARRSEMLVLQRHIRRHYNVIAAYVYDLVLDTDEQGAIDTDD